MRDNKFIDSLRVVKVEPNLKYVATAASQNRSVRRAVHAVIRSREPTAIPTP